MRVLSPCLREPERGKQPLSLPATRNVVWLWLVSDICARISSLKKYGPGVILRDISSPPASARTVTGEPTGLVVVDGDRFVKSAMDPPISRPAIRTAASTLRRCTTCFLPCDLLPPVTGSRNKVCSISTCPERLSSESAAWSSSIANRSAT